MSFWIIFFSIVEWIYDIRAISQNLIRLCHLWYLHLLCHNQWLMYIIVNFNWPSRPPSNIDAMCWRHWYFFDPFVSFNIFWHQSNYVDSRHSCLGSIKFTMYVWCIKAIETSNQRWNYKFDLCPVQAIIIINTTMRYRPVWELSKCGCSNWSTCGLQWWRYGRY